MDFQEEIEGQKEPEGDQQQAEAAPAKKSQDSSAQNETTIDQKVIYLFPVVYAQILNFVVK